MTFPAGSPTGPGVMHPEILHRDGSGRPTSLLFGSFPCKRVGLLVSPPRVGGLKFERLEEKVHDSEGWYVLEEFRAEVLGKERFLESTIGELCGATLPDGRVALTYPLNFDGRSFSLVAVFAEKIGKTADQKTWLVRWGEHSAKWRFPEN